MLFIEASREFQEASSAQNSLRDEDVNKIATTFHAFKDVDRYARVVDLNEIEKNDFNLNISRYVETTIAAERVDLAGAVSKLRELDRTRDEAEALLNRHLRELGFG